MTTQKEKKQRILTLPCVFGSAPWTRRSSTVGVSPYLLAYIRAVNPFCWDQYQDKNKYLITTQMGIKVE